MTNYLSNIQKLYFKRLFQPDILQMLYYRCSLNLSSNSARKITIMVYWHALLALSPFGLIAPCPTHEDLRKEGTLFPLCEGIWTHTSPSHQTKASLSPNLCPEPADSGLSMEFPHYPEVLVRFLWGLFCFAKKHISTGRGGGENVIWLREARIEKRIPIMLCRGNYHHVLISISNQTLMNMYSDFIFSFYTCFCGHFYKKKSFLADLYYPSHTL